MTYVQKTVGSPVGGLRLVAGHKGLAGVLWARDDPRRVRLAPVAENASHPVLRDAERQLEEYFAGRRTAFDLDLDFVGTDFQRRVWAALVEIPFGETVTYGEVARRIGSPDAVRAVGSAANRNPIAIVAPCHRVVGASGRLTGFAGGLDVKAKLLAVEGRHYGEDATRDSVELATRRRGRPRPQTDAPSLFDWL
jgi:methylated-DNA-[protein]-cysteine S-methyltransferase